MAGWFPLFAAPATPDGHNGGLSQVNLAPIQSGGDYPFLDVVKTAQNWSNSGGPKQNWIVDPENNDSNGMPTVAPYGYYAVCFVPSSAERSGNYVCRWTASGGSSTVNTVGTIVDGSASTTGTSGRYVFSLTTTRLTPGVASMSDGYVTGIHIMHEDDEAAWLLDPNGFGTQLLHRLNQAKFGIIRSLNWMADNNNNISLWSDEKPSTYFSFAAMEFRPDLMAGATTLTDNAYTADAPSTWPGLVHGVKAHVRFDQTSPTGTVTLNIGSTGDIPIRDRGANPLSGTPGEGGSTYPVGGTYQSIGTVTYDADLNVWIKHGGDTSGLGSVGIVNNCPTSVFLKLCKEVGAHPHFTAPYLACDPVTDYIANQALEVKNFKNSDASWMNPRAEGPNEQWNGSFQQSQYSQVKANDFYGWTTRDFNAHYGKIMSQLGQVYAAVFGGVSNLNTAYKVLCGVHTVSTPSDADDRLSSSRYIAYGTAQSDLDYDGGTIAFTAASGSAEAWRWVSNLALANYFSPLRRFTSQELTDGYDYTVTHAGDATAQAALAESYVGTLDGDAGDYNIAQNASLFASWQSWASGYDATIKICGYEGGYSPDYISGVGNCDSSSWYITTSSASKASPAVISFDSSGVTFNSERPFFGGNPISGNPAAVGQAVVLQGQGVTELNNPYPETVSFAGSGSADINGSNTLVLNQAVFFYGETLPSELTKIDTLTLQAAVGTSRFYSKPYYVVSTGNPFQISETRSGSPITFGSSDTVSAQECWFVTDVTDTSMTLDCDSTAFTGTSTTGYVIFVHSQIYSNNLRFAGKQTDALATQLIADWNAMISAGGEFPSCFQLSGISPSGNVWSVLETVYQTPDPPAWGAMVNFNS